MNSERTRESSQTILKELVNEKKSGFNNRLMWVQMLVFLAGSALLVYLIYKTGFYTIYSIISQIGWYFFIIVLLNGLRHFLRAWCIYLTVPPLQRFFKYRNAVAARLGGEAVSFITFTGPFLGDATKAALLKKHIPLSQSGAAIIIDDIIYYISVVMLILSGIGLMSLAYTNNNTMKIVLIAVAVGSFLIFAGVFLLIWFRIKPLSFVIKRLSGKNLIPNFVLKQKDWIYELEDNVYQMFLYRRPTFFAVFGINLLAHFLSVMEVYAALRLLGFIASFKTAYIIEALTKVINFSFSFVPGAVGVYEGGNGLILQTLGFTTAAGVALALVRRGSIFFWTFIGLAVLLWRSVSHSTEKISKRLS